MSDLLQIEGQPKATKLLRGAVAQPVHAYLFLGPRGAGKRQGALAFASALIGSNERSRRLALAGRHPDLSIHEPEGRSLRVAEADQIIFEASRTPVEANFKVIVCDRFHSAEPEAVASLLKTIEEPPSTVVIVLLSEEIPPNHQTVASRCVLVEFDPVPDAEMRRILESQGVSAEALDSILTAAAGDLSRARLLANDTSLNERKAAWASIPTRLDGTGHTVAKLTDELQGLIDKAQEPLKARQQIESQELAQIEADSGKQGRQHHKMDARHRREERLLRSDELRFGMATLAKQYSQQMTNKRHARDCVVAIARLREAHACLICNPNEALLLQALLLSLPNI
ncbi:MAG: hypothetical protein F4138_07955 [Acidimicrobiia bacterium]|nr:hypothetical protein [Acidimicrobiia bacterium]MYC57602.1 hypothetical protein [Acidimicrobiia bacterium]MYG94892.1 hypothetical protein [Acidimicrobiia bacterium]MYI31267.1 hypothetical protein [Acidimicrobiia bacterium]